MNSFREGDGGKLLWGGNEENFRVFKWIFQRITGRRDAADAKKTAIGYVCERSKGKERKRKDNLTYLIRCLQ
jgi:GTP-dependent phosphoenolpyruvate carboxykinase